MFVGWRVIDDLPRLLEVGDGTVEIDLLTAATSLQGKAVEPLRISREISLWLLEQFEVQRIPKAEVTTARLTVNFSAQDAPGRSPGHTQRRLRFRCESAIEVGDKTAAGVLVDEQFGVQKGDGPWTMY
jgi:hypothetical protein